MKCYSLDEHFVCNTYDGGENPMLNILELKAGQIIKRETIYNKLLLVVKGEINYSYGMHDQMKVEENNLFILPSGYKVELDMMKDSRLILFRINTLQQLCDQCQLEQLLNIDCEVDPNKPYQLAFNGRVASYINGLLTYFEDGLRCYFFQELKLKELFYIFRRYYSKEDMKRLFYTLLTNDISFSELVLKASTSARSLTDLADATGYSISGFGKRFRKVFEVAPYQWLQQKRAERLFFLIKKKDLPLKVIIDIERFVSSSELNRFSRRYYGDTPGNIRKKNEKDEKLRKKGEMESAQQEINITFASHTYK